MRELTKNTVKRILSAFLVITIATAVFITALLPVNDIPVYADNDKTISGLCTGVIANPTSGAGGWSYVYYGTYGGNAMKYRVLDKSATQFGGNTMLLDCNNTIENKQFDSSSNVWANSGIRTWLNGNDFYGNANVFKAQEKAAIASSTKGAPDERDPNNKDGNGWQGILGYAPLAGEYIFLLDAVEATRPSYGYKNTDNPDNARKKTGTANFWWLRSPYSFHVNYAGVVITSGTLDHGHLVSNDYTDVSPAFNINLASVIFSSLIPNKTNEYKLTVKDTNMTIATTYGSDVTRDGNVVTVPYTITGGAPTQVSVLITDEEYSAGLAVTDGFSYQKLNVTTWDTSGTGTFTLPDAYADQTCGTDYYAYILAEDVNGTYETDYASAPALITIPNREFVLEYDANGGSGEMTSTTVSIGETYTFPECGFDPPANKTFNYWRMSGVDTYSFQPGATQEIADNCLFEEKVTVTAHWKDAEKVATPTFTPREGKYTAAQKVKLSCDTEGATIHYTTDGNPPTASSPTYKSAIAVSETMTIRAIAVKDGMADSDVATAKYTIEEPPTEYWTVSFDPNANDASGKMDPQQIEKGKTDNLKTNKYTREGFTFDGWNTKKDGSGTKYADKASFKPEGDTTLYAQWKEVKKYSVTVTADPANGGTVKSSVASGKSGTKVTITAAAGKDFLFKEWKVVAGDVELADSKQPETTFSIKNADVKVTAIFEVKEADTYTVTATTDGHGTATANPTSGKAGTKVTLKAVSDAGYKFKKWKVVSGGVKPADAAKAKTTFKVKNANVKVKAIFEKIYEEPQPEIESKGEDKIILAWFKVNEAKGYDIFMSRCNHGGKEITPKLIKTIKNKNTTQWTVTGLKPNKSYKAIIKAYTKDKNGKKKYISKSPLMHVYTAGGNKTYTNAKSVKIDKSDGKIKKGNKLTLKVKDTYNIKASVKKADKSRELMPDSHVKTLRYRSSDPGVASVGASGKITAKKPGKCKIYVYAHNGVNKTINVTVK